MKNAFTSAPFASSTRSNPNEAVGVSIIIPAHNAGGTLEATLNSVLQQSYPEWEAIIVDDGSTDGLGTMAQKWVDRDRRFRLLRQEKAGVSAARNRGLVETLHPFVLFLDADDRIAPTHLERMVGVLLADSTLDAVHCGWQRVLPSGVLGPPHLGSDQEDLFEHFAVNGTLAIHACILRRNLALVVGGFDTSLRTCEDWDFFQRVARTGARFGRVSEVLAFYYVYANSASQDSLRFLNNARMVLRRGHGRDLRMRSIAQVHPEGKDPAHRNLALYHLVTYLAAQEIGAGREGLDLLNAGDFPAAPDLSFEAVASIIEEPLLTAADRSVQDWPALWSRVNGPIGVFLGKLEDHSRAPALAFATLRQFEKKIALTHPGVEPLLIGSTYRFDVDVTRPFRDLLLPPDADRIICRLISKGEPIGSVELPGIGVVSGQRIAEAASERHTRLLLGRALTPLRSVRLGWRTVRDLLRRRPLRMLYAVVAAKPGDRSSAVRRLRQEAVCLVKTNLSRAIATRPSRATKELEEQWQERLKAVVAAGRAYFRKQAGASPQSSTEWDKIFSLPDPWAYESDYEVRKFEQTLALLPDVVFANALEIACAEGHFTVRLAPLVGALTAVDISDRALARARKRCAKHPNVIFKRLDLNDSDIVGLFDLIVCSEVLYYVRNLKDVVAQLLAQVREGGFFLTAHARVLSDDPEGTGFDWGDHIGAETIAKAIDAQTGIALIQELCTPLYRVLLYRRLAPGQQRPPAKIVKSLQVGRMTSAAEALARWPGGMPARLAAEPPCAVPILMYHRVAAQGPNRLERYRVTPELFSGQLSALHTAGYRTIGLHDWINAVNRREALSGKPIILTFDDGYRDFLNAAMPILRSHDFSATVFLVSDRIGGVADWDAEYGESAPLLSWEEVRSLQEAGIEFGCHSSLHRPLIGMHLRELAEDTVRARAILEEGLGTPVNTFAYPYGAVNEFVYRVIADLGFRAAVSCEEGVSRLEDNPLQLRRIEVPGGCTPEQVISRINISFEKARR